MWASPSRRVGHQNQINANGHDKLSLIQSPPPPQVFAGEGIGRVNDVPDARMRENADDIEKNQTLNVRSFLMF